MYLYAAERFSVVVALLAICLAVLKVFATNDFGWLCNGASGAFGRPVIFEDQNEDSD